jgi:hypothetical protein
LDIRRAPHGKVHQVEGRIFQPPRRQERQEDTEGTNLGAVAVVDNRRRGCALSWKGKPGRIAAVINRRKRADFPTAETPRAPRRDQFVEPRRGCLRRIRVGGKDEARSFDSNNSVAVAFKRSSPSCAYRTC